MRDLTTLRQFVGPVVLAHARAAIACDDSLRHLPRLPPYSIDLVLTSPPYNIGMQCEDDLPLGDYTRWCGEWLRELERVCAPRGSVWINVGRVRVPEKGTAVPLPYLY